MKSCRGMGGAFSFVQVEQDIDIDYIKEILAKTKERTEGQSYLEKRAEATAEVEADLEEEVMLAHEEIKDIDKELKSLLTVAEYLLES
jgi:hypothetical protein